MTNIIAAKFSIDQVVNIDSSYMQLGITKLQAKVFKDFYGLHQVAICEVKNLDDLLCESISNVLSMATAPEEINYVIFAHTSLTNSPFSYGLLSRVILRTGLSNAKYFGISLNKCASFVESFSLVNSIFTSDSSAKNILLLSGDRAFTKQQRLLQNASIAGDAAGAVLFKRNETSKASLKFISSEKIVFPKFYKGSWLSKEDEKEFEDKFPVLMSSAIINCCKKAELPLEKIKYVLPHNVNYPVWKKISEVMKCDVSKIFTRNINKYGHCFSTDSLINLSTVTERLSIGDFILVATVGFGLTFVVSAFQKTRGDN